MGAVRGKYLARLAYNRIFFRSLVLAFDHWSILMYDFKERYHTGPDYLRSKMQAILKIKREEEKEAMRKEALELKLAVRKATDVYRVDVLPDGTRVLPHFDIRVPGWFPVTILVSVLRIFRAIGQAIILFRNGWAWFAASPLLDNLVATAVFTNTVLMCCEHSRQSVLGRLWGDGAEGDINHVRFQSKMELGFIVLIVFYTFEAFFKILGLGYRNYFSNPTNLFDFFLMLVSAGQFNTSVSEWHCVSTAARIEDCENSSSGLASLRVLRLIRVVRYFRRMRLIQEQISIISDVMSSSYSLILLMMMFVLMFASLGSQLFFSSMALSVNDPNTVGLGTQVWIDHVAGMKSPTNLPGLPGYVATIHPNNSIRIWSVQLVTTFGDLEQKLKSIIVCPSQNICENHLNFVLPRAHFASYTQSIVSVMQIMLRSGWIDIFRNCVAGSGYLFPTIFFGVIFFMWTYFLGNICSAVLIVGFSKKFDGEKRQLQALALKEQKIRALHTKFKNALVAEYVQRLEEPQDKDNNDEISKKNKQKIKKLLARTTKALGNDRLDNNLHHDPFDQSASIDPEYDFSSLRTGETQGVSANQNYGVIERLLRDEDTPATKGKSKQLVSEDEVEIRKIQESLIKMSNYDREMYLREGLNNLQVGQHLATTLGIASSLLQRRMDKLIALRATSPSQLHAAYYNQQIGPLAKRIKDVQDRIEALRHGHQTGMAFFVLRPYHPLRILACNIVHRLWFERMMGSCVLASCVTLWVQKPRMASQDQALLDSANTVFNFLFLMECILKVLIEFSILSEHLTLRGDLYPFSSFTDYRV
jgi:hypothetical protein